jgi:hypothetical protein
MSRIPGDRHIRAMLDPAEPGLLYPVFGAVLTELIQLGPDEKQSNCPGPQNATIESGIRLARRGVGWLFTLCVRH